jgi:hypothetical protein
MDRVGAALRGRADLLRGVEVGRDLNRLVGRASVERGAIVRRCYSNGCDAELTAGTEDAKRNLPPVRYEELANRAGYLEGPFGSPRVSGTKIPGGGDGGGGGGCCGFLAIAISV